MTEMGEIQNEVGDLETKIEELNDLLLGEKLDSRSHALLLTQLSAMRTYAHVLWLRISENPIVVPKIDSKSKFIAFDGTDHTGLCNTQDECADQAETLDIDLEDNPIYEVVATHTKTTAWKRRPL